MRIEAVEPERFLVRIDLDQIQKYRRESPMVGPPRYFALVPGEPGFANGIVFYPEPEPHDRARWEEQVVRRAVQWGGWTPETIVPKRTLMRKRITKEHRAVDRQVGDEVIGYCETCGEAWPCWTITNIKQVVKVALDTEEAFGVGR